MTSYWSWFMNQRLSRRKALAGSTKGGLAAVLLAACGGSGEGQRDHSGLVSTREKNFSGATPGGTWVKSTSTTFQAGAIDPHRNVAAGSFSIFAPTYSALAKYGFDTSNRTPSSSLITGDAAESWELAPDGMQITFKLRRNHKFDPRPPTSGRAMTSADVKFSWDRMSAFSAWAGDILNSKSEAGPLQSLSTPDDQTVVVKLAFPYGALMEIFAFWYLFIAPQEADWGFDPRSETRGSGPFFLTSVHEHTGYVYKKNPDWYVKGRPYLDGIEAVPLAEYATALAQFEAKAIWTYDDIRQGDILRVKRDHPPLVMYQDPLAGALNSQTVTFSQSEQSPFKDVRLRRAASMAIDRDLFIDTFHNIADFAKAGIPVERLWTSHLSIKAQNYLNPKDKDFGENAKFFQFNPAEAKRLVSAAGNPSVEYLSRQSAGIQWFGYADVFSEMLTQAGFSLARKALGTADWRRAKESAGDGYPGLFQNTAFGFNDDAFLTAKYTPSGKDRIAKSEISGINDAIKKIRTEQDTKRRGEMIKQIQRDLAALMLDLPMEREAVSFSLRWPWLKNHGVLAGMGFATNGVGGESLTARVQTEYWYDKAEHQKYL